MGAGYSQLESQHLTREQLRSLERKVRRDSHCKQLQAFRFVSRSHVATMVNHADPMAHGKSSAVCSLPVCLVEMVEPA